VPKMKDQGPKFEKKYRTKLLEAPKLGSNGIWGCISSVLFLVKPSFDTLGTI